MDLNELVSWTPVEILTWENIFDLRLWRLLWIIFETVESKCLNVFDKEALLKHFANFMGKHLQWSSIFRNVAAFACSFIKYKTPLQVFLFICDVFQKNHSVKHIWMAASVWYNCIEKNRIVSSFLVIDLSKNLNDFRCSGDKQATFNMHQTFSLFSFYFSLYLLTTNYHFGQWIL